jgi:uncharacterized protein (TIGR02679 family)
MSELSRANLDHVQARLERAAFGFVVDELVRRYSAGDEPSGLTLRPSSPDDRRALADLLGRDRLPPDPIRLSVAKLATALGLASPNDLRAVVERLRGPLPDRRAERAEMRSSRQALWEWLATESATVPIGDLAAWVEALRVAGVRGEVRAFRRRLETALAVLRTLPADGVSLAALANDVADDPHALDPGRPLNSLVLDAIACATGMDRARDAESVRTLWESAGVVPDVLSSSVLVLGVVGSDDDPLGRWLTAATRAGEPVVLTLAMLRRWPPRPLPVDATAYVVENPSLIADAATRGWTGPPLICSSGRPSVAVVTLLRCLTSEGARVRQHADFDPAGVAITAWLVDRAGTIPWRMTAADYATAAARLRSPLTLESAIPSTPWDPALQIEMARRRAAVYEEAVRADLLDAIVGQSDG